MKPHKWAKEIKAWADGAEIELKHEDGSWQPIRIPLWQEGNEYRIKPQPKEPQYLYVYQSVNGTGTLIYYFEKNTNMKYKGKIKLEMDND